MEGSDGSPPPSLCMIRAAELFPKPTMEKEDNQLIVPFQELSGEAVKYLGRTDDGVLALSNYRIFLLKNPTCSETSVPLGLIESAQTRDLFHLIINCKDASTVKCSFETAEQCSEWQRRITLSVGVPEALESLFAFPFYSWTSDSSSAADKQDLTMSRLLRATRFEDDFRKEVERLQFDLNGTWRISQANAEFKLCASYPQMILVPCCISDDTLHNVANFRGSRRLPAVVWRHKKSGAVIARCSQPEVGWLGWRNSKDEQYLKALADACAFDRGEQNRRLNLCTSGESTPSSPEGSHEEVSLDEVRKILIVDARSYTSAVTNRARGGGCECIEYYPCAEIEFMSLGNIHAIRKSFHALRQLCASPPDVPNWLTLLEKTGWLQHLSGLLAASVTVCLAIEKKGRPVLVHCSDGWDRTPQIVATAQLCLDPFYRTVEGFRILVEREWLQYGHKFADRCGHGPGSDETNERCPVFLQWLDLVNQIHRQFPCCFEFSMGYLIKLAQHSHSCLFGTFLCNTLKERLDNAVFERTFSVWQFLSGPMYKNPLYVSNKEKVLWPAYNVRDLNLWTEVYLGSLGNQNVADFPPCSGEANPESTNLMTKTRSYGDLLTAGINQNGLSRRSSDPNMTVESNLNNFVADRTPSPDIDEVSSEIIANTIHNTTEKIQNLTNELQNQDDEEICKINNAAMVENGKDEVDTFNDVLLYSKMKHKINSFDNGITIINHSLDDENSSPNSICDDSDADGGSVSNGNCDENIDAEDTGLHFGNMFVNGDNSNGCPSTTVTSNDFVDGRNAERLSDEIDSKLMESIDLSKDSKSISPANDIDILQSPWHGSVHTSTDTLVPIETHHSHNNTLVDIETDRCEGANGGDEQEDEGNTTTPCNKMYDNCDDDAVDSVRTNLKEEKKINILPEVHCKPNFSSLNNSSNNSNNNNNQMEESILILPEHQKLEISSSGKCETIVNNITHTTSSHRRRRTSSTNSKIDFCNFSAVNGSATTSRFSTPGVRSLPLTPPGVSDRPQIAISCPDGLAHALSEQNIRLQQIVYEHKVREDSLLRELHGMRLALVKKTCPSCNNPQNPNNDEQVDVMMYEQNNIVELCDSCSSRNRRRCFDGGAIYFGTSPESASSTLDHLESMSVCSWEAVEDKSGPSSCTSSIQPGGSVRWVPDYAVSRCTICQTEFWLGRRKHHCRSCGQIFCADCSEFWAPLPDERLYNPVRLCGPCYHSVTTRMQLQQSRTTNSSSTNVSQYNTELSTANSLSTTGVVNLKNSSSSSSIKNITNFTNINPPASALEACKHVANSPRNDCGQLKATAASN